MKLVGIDGREYLPQKKEEEFKLAL